MMTTMKKTTALAAMLLVCACSGSENSTSNNGANGAENNDANGAENNASMVDMGEDMPAENNTSPNTTTMEDMPEDMPLACESITACPADACGMISDGCDGTLDCGTCLCEDGAPVVDSCGACGLGVVDCTQGDHGACVEPDVGLFDLSVACGQLTHVKPGADNDTADGSLDSPYGSIEAALKNTEAPGIIIAGGGDYTQAGVLPLRPGISILGGYDFEAGAFDPATPSVLTVSASSSQRPVEGLLAEGINQPTVVAHLEVRTEDATSPSQNNYGARVINSPELYLYDVTIVAGAGGDGEDGADGADGADGPAGGDAGQANVYNNEDLPEVTADRGYTGALEGMGAQNLSCPGKTAGSNGGRGAHAWFELPDLEQLIPASDGDNTYQGIPGGNAGTPMTIRGADGADGMEGTPGQDGRDGDSGEAFIDGYVKRPDFAEDGTRGEDGQGGSGGGGAWWPTADQGFGEVPGSSGGGGGAGGCGGEGGEGGGDGGLSVGLTLAGSDGVMLHSVTVQASKGGDGGDGGLGGRGGLGGAGGAPSAEWTKLSTTTPYAASEFGGKGGAGADGGDGGDGGVGAGGSSIGMWCENTRFDRMGDVIAEAGEGGAGGVVPEMGDAGLSLDLNRGCTR